MAHGDQSQMTSPSASEVEQEQKDRSTMDPTLRIPDSPPLFPLVSNATLAKWDHDAHFVFPTFEFADEQTNPDQSKRSGDGDVLVIKFHPLLEDGEALELHRAIFENDVDRFDHILSHCRVSLNARDKHGTFSLPLAVNFRLENVFFLVLFKAVSTFFTHTNHILRPITTTYPL